MLPGHVSCHSLFKRSHILYQSLQYCQPLCQFLSYCSIKPISCNCICVVDVGIIMALFRWIFSCRLKSGNHLSTQELAYLNGKFLCLWKWVNIIGPWLKDTASVRLQIIYSHLMDCTMTYWKSSSSLVIFLMLFNGLHQWPVIKWIIPCSTSSPFIHMVKNYVFWNWKLKTLGYYLLSFLSAQVAME